MTFGDQNWEGRILPSQGLGAETSLKYQENHLNHMSEPDLHSFDSSLKPK